MTTTTKLKSARVPSEPIQQRKLPGDFIEKLSVNNVAKREIHLDDLPQEMLRAIGEKLDRKSLPSFHETSNALRTAANRV